jgi:hypothetical protein
LRSHHGQLYGHPAELIPPAAHVPQLLLANDIGTAHSQHAIDQLRFQRELPEPSSGVRSMAQAVQSQCGSVMFLGM